MRTTTATRSVVNGIAIVVAAGLVGLVGLPLVFGRLPEFDLALVWLAVAVVDCGLLLLPTRTLASALADLLGRLPGRGRQSASAQLATTEIARVLVATISLVLVQAIVRHPLVAVLGANAEPFLVEAVFAIVAVLALFSLLCWLYRAARPFIEGVAWVALDAAFATSSSEAATRTAATLGPVVSSTVAAQPGEQATLTREVQSSAREP
jgi:hypothetical protein